MRRGTRLGLLDRALVLDLFRTYSLGVVHTRWTVNSHITLTAVVLRIQREFDYVPIWNHRGDFMSGQQWQPEIMRDVPAFMNGSDHPMVTFLVGTYRICTFRIASSGMAVCWYRPGQLVHRDILRGYYRVVGVCSGYITVVGEHGQYDRLQLKLALVTPPVAPVDGCMCM